MSHVRRYEHGVHDLCVGDVSIPMEIAAKAETYCKGKIDVRYRLDLASERAAELGRPDDCTRATCIYLPSLLYIA